MTMTTSPNKKLWDKWLSNQDMDAANELVKQYNYLVSFHVDRLSAHLPKSVQKDDLVSLAYMGLFDAIKKFEPSRKLKFDTYASFRIRGSIIDGLRREDWLPRSLREKTKQVEQTSDQLEQKLQRKPTPSEIAKQLNMTPAEVEETVKNSLFANVLSIDQRTTDTNDEEPEGIGYIIPDKENETPDEQLVKLEMKQEVAKAIQLLNKNEQLVISLFYHDELTMTEIGEVLNLTTSRISQIHKQALYKMKDTLKDLSLNI
ncbi:MAG TPA: FliA/WhiG family RNA polymerase sigma factor [Bacillota bacterium]|nr:FliA/WhiG family RNA polymerase sigma factor [Bacillota bacterium]